MGLPVSALKPGASVTGPQGLPAMTLTLGRDFLGAGVRLDRSRTVVPDVEKSTADRVECAR